MRSRERRGPYIVPESHRNIDRAPSSPPRPSFQTIRPMHARPSCMQLNSLVPDRRRYQPRAVQNLWTHNYTAVSDEYKLRAAVRVAIHCFGAERCAS